MDGTVASGADGRLLDPCWHGKWSASSAFRPVAWFSGSGLWGFGVSAFLAACLRCCTLDRSVCIFGSAPLAAFARRLCIRSRFLFLYLCRKSRTQATILELHREDLHVLRQRRVLRIPFPRARQRCCARQPSHSRSHPWARECGNRHFPTPTAGVTKKALVGHPETAPSPALDRVPCT